LGNLWDNSQNFLFHLGDLWEFSQSFTFHIIPSNEKHRYCIKSFPFFIISVKLHSRLFIFKEKNK
jgi:hypothetical protein